MKILVIRLSSIGDIVLTTPIIRCLKQQLHAEVHLLTRRNFLPVLASNKHISRFIGIENDLNAALIEIKKEGYDVIVDLHKNLRTLKLQLRLKQRFVVFNKLNLKKLLLTKAKINLLPQKHLVDRYFDAVKKLGVTNDGLGLDFYISAKNDLNCSEITNFSSGYIALSIGAQHETKKFPIKKWLKITNLLPYPFVILGGADVQAEAKYLCDKSTNKNIYNATGKYNLEQSAVFLNSSSLVMTNDTGLMHIASALKKKIFVMWGNTVPAFGMYPYLPQGQPKYVSFEINNLHCRPCSKIGFASCPKTHFYCMNLIDELDIAEKAGQYLNIEINNE